MGGAHLGAPLFGETLFSGGLSSRGGLMGGPCWEAPSFQDTAEPLSAADRELSVAVWCLFCLCSAAHVSLSFQRALFSGRSSKQREGDDMETDDPASSSSSSSSSSSRKGGIFSGVRTVKAISKKKAMSSKLGGSGIAKGGREPSSFPQGNLDGPPDHAPRTLHITTTEAATASSRKKQEAVAHGDGGGIRVFLRGLFGPHENWVLDTRVAVNVAAVYRLQRGPAVLCLVRGIGLPVGASQPAGSGGGPISVC
ncbi:hypothetical protein ACSSS7_005330 [Eimeria intestinalis]